MAYAIRRRITAELMASFALSQKRIEEHIKAMTKGIADKGEREATAQKIRELEEDRNIWFIKQRKNNNDDTICRHKHY